MRVENLDTGASREINSDGSGRFTFSQLQPGRYRVTTAAGTREVVVRVDELGVSGISGVEWDAVELPSQFMENYCWEKIRAQYLQLLE